MEDDRPRRTRAPVTLRPMHGQSAARSLGVVVVAALFAGGLSGCSLFVMAGKMFFGDPEIPAAFHAATGIDLAEGEKTVLVVCTVPEWVKSDFPSIESDLAGETIRRLRGRGVPMVDPDDVATWIDDQGGYWNDASELAGDFDVDIIVHVDLERFSTQEENSPWMLRGRAVGEVRGYEVREQDGEKTVDEIFVREFTSVHPESGPISADRSSAQLFQRRYTERIATELVHMLHDFRASEMIQ